MATNKTEANNTIRSTTIKSLQKTGRQAGNSNVCKSKGRQRTVRSPPLTPGKITCQRGRGSASTERGTQRGIWPSAPGTGRRQDSTEAEPSVGQTRHPQAVLGDSIIPTPEETAPSLSPDCDSCGCLSGRLDLLLENCRQRPRSSWSVLLCATLNATPPHTRPQRLRPRRLPSTRSKYPAAGMAGSPSCLRAAPLFTLGEREVRAPTENPPYVRDDKCGMETPPC